MFWFKMGSDQKGNEVSVVASSQGESLSFWMFCWSGTAIMSLMGCCGILCDAATKKSSLSYLKSKPCYLWLSSIGAILLMFGNPAYILTGAMIPVMMMPDWTDQLVDGGDHHCFLLDQSVVYVGLCLPVCASVFPVWVVWTVCSVGWLPAGDRVCMLVKGLGVVWVLRALGLLREKMFLRRGAFVALRRSSWGKMRLRKVCDRLTHLSKGIFCQLLQDSGFDESWLEL